MAASLRSRVLLNLLVANAIVLGALAVWAEISSTAQEQHRQDYLLQLVGDRLERFESERAADLAAIVTWPLWSEFADALIIDHRVVDLNGRPVPVGTWLNPLGSAHREPGFPLEEITAAMSQAVSAGATTKIAGGVALPLKRSSRATMSSGTDSEPSQAAWAGVFVRPKALPIPMSFSLQVVLAAAFSTLAAAALVWLLLRRAVLRPVEVLAAAARDFDATSKVDLPSASGVVEIDEMVSAFDSMTTRISGFQGELAGKVKVATTRAVEAERRASRQDRLAAMGTLAAGLAHEINSPLAGAINGVEVLRDQPEPAKAERYGELVATALKRISGLVNRMLQLAPARPEGGECELEVVVADLKDFVASRLQQHRFTTELSSTPLRLKVAAGDLFPVLLNLLRNALDSLDQLPQEQAGLVTLSATSEAGQVIICLRDNGSGAAPEILEHLFEPFVTDKDVGTGTGLGLALAHATVRSLGGSIEADNLESGGFEVVLRLPQA